MLQDKLEDLQFRKFLKKKNGNIYKGEKKHLPFDVFEPKGPLAYFMFKTLSCTIKW